MEKESGATALAKAADSVTLGVTRVMVQVAIPVTHMVVLGNIALDQESPWYANSGQGANA
jgi:hypothetical protein